MIRFRNPGVEYTTQVQVLKQLYINLKEFQSFTLDDMATVIAQGRLMTAYGYAGNTALELSSTENDSMNSAKMNAKMYAEVFRMLGWVTPSGDKSYPLEFTYIGMHVATATDNLKKLYEQCVLGINNPTELSGKLRYNEQVRFFKCVLRSLVDLDDIMYKHEFSLGPMSVNDIDEKEYQKMIAYIKSLRGDNKRLKKAFKDLANNLGMKETPVDNCTRIPVALLKTCEFAEDYSSDFLYPPSTKKCLKITEYGKNTLKKMQEMKDLRLEEFNKYNEEEKMALIRLGIFSMLRRADYDIEPIKEQFDADKKLCSHILLGKELLFSPYQTIRHDLIDKAMGFEKKKKESINKIEVLRVEENLQVRYNAKTVREMWNLDVKTHILVELLTSEKDILFLEEVKKLHTQGKKTKEIVELLMIYYGESKKDVFYPLIATLFKIMGFKCIVSRDGDNGARWDAMIEDESRSIPIEIKSPAEEKHISIKGIRQAVENKIVLLSRQTYETRPEVTTLAVGYYLPNERAEVSRLINDFKITYDVKVGVLDLVTLLKIAISILIDGVGFDKEYLYSFGGMIGEDSKGK